VDTSRDKEVAEMDVRLDVTHQQPALQRPYAGQLRKDRAGRVEAVESERVEEERPETAQKATVAPPQVISREELQQFLLLLGTTRGSEELLSAMVHDASKMRGMLLGGKT